MSKRNKSKRQGGDDYALIPRRVAQSEAFCSLSPGAYRLLVLALCEYRGSKTGASNNGDISISWLEMRPYGFSSNATFTRALRELCDKRLLQQTRQGGLGAGGKRPSLYAFTWLPLSKHSHLDAEIKTPSAATDAWRSWSPPSRDRPKRKPPKNQHQQKFDAPKSETACTDERTPHTPTNEHGSNLCTDLSVRTCTDESVSLIRSTREGPPAQERSSEGGHPQVDPCVVDHQGGGGQSQAGRASPTLLPDDPATGEADAAGAARERERMAVSGDPAPPATHRAHARPLDDQATETLSSRDIASDSNRDPSKSNRSEAPRPSPINQYSNRRCPACGGEGGECGWCHGTGQRKAAEALR